MQEFLAIPIFEKVRRDSWCVFSCRDGEGAEFEVVTTAEPDEIVCGLTYRFYGREKQSSYGNGKQIHAKSFVRSQPHGRIGVERYLQRAPWIGSVGAATLWQKFGSDAVRIAREEPAVAQAAIGGSFNLERAKAAAAQLQAWKGLEDCQIDLIDVLDKRGFSRKMPQWVMEEFGNAGGEIIRRNPYCLMRFRTGSFPRTDKMYLDFGGDPSRLKRQAYCGAYELAADTEGHTWQPVEVFTEGIRKNVSQTDILPAAALKLAVRGKIVSHRRDADGRLWVSDRRRAVAESFVARRLAELTRESDSQWPTELRGLSDHQSATVLPVLASGPVAVLTGGPGTGKTFTAASLVQSIIEEYGFDSVAVCAPTGKARVRIKEVMRGYGIDCFCSTIHGLLRVEGKTSGEGWSFAHDQDNPLPFRYILVDESSMIDTTLLASLLRACGRGTHVLFVGDPHQLPPVGHGAPLRDMIAAGLPHAELTEVRRNSGAIVAACHEIRYGRIPRICEKIDLEAESPENLGVIRCRKDQIASKVLAAITACHKKYDFDPVWDIQVIVPINPGDVGRKTMSELIQDALNPHGKPAGNSGFRLGDKVVCTDNGLRQAFIGDETDERDFGEKTEDAYFVANGETAAVSGVRDKMLIIRLIPEEHRIKVPVGGGGDDDEKDKEGSATGGWLLGGAQTCHKMQGSECPVVIIVLDESRGARRTCSREWLRTALSRAKSLAICVGRVATLEGMCRRSALEKRQTFLAEDIKAEIAKLEREPEYVT